MTHDPNALDNGHSGRSQNYPEWYDGDESGQGKLLKAKPIDKGQTRGEPGCTSKDSEVRYRVLLPTEAASSRSHGQEFGDDADAGEFSLGQARA